MFFSNNSYIENNSNDTVVSGSHLSNHGNNVTLIGGDGDDGLLNYGSNVTMIGNDGSDYLSNDGNNVAMIGGNGDERFYNNGSHVTINGGDGNDTINSFSTLTSHDYEGYVTLLGGNGKDSIAAFGHLVFADGGVDDDSIYSSGKNNTVFGGEGNDSITNYGAYSMLYGNAGDDSINNTSIGDHSTIIGGTGNDTIILGTASDNNIIEYASGDGNDIIEGFNSDDTIRITSGTYTKSTSGNDFILTVGNGSIVFKDTSEESINIIGTVADSVQITAQAATVVDTVDLSEKASATSANVTYVYNITNTGSGNVNIITGDGNIVENNNTTNYTSNYTVNFTYSGGYKKISNYKEGDIIELKSDYTGIGLEGNSCYVNSSSGSLEIQNSRDKFIAYSAGSTQISAYSYVASSGGVIDGRDKNQAEIMIGGDNADNQIFAGNAGSSLWGGAGGADTLTGGDGYDEFFYAMGSGADIIQNAGTNDLVNLSSISLTQISGVEVNIGQVNIDFVDGGNLQVQGGSSVAYQIAEGTFQVNQSTGQWSNK